MNNIENSILNAIKNLINKKVKELKFDYTITGKVTELVDENGFYTVNYNESEIKVKTREGLNLQVGDIVYIRCIQGNFSEKFIDCKRP